jgi:hypothetical protein
MPLIEYEPKSTPQFEHGCSMGCTYLGQFEGYDLYFCPQHTIPTVIARFGDEPHEYMSGMPRPGAEALPPLAIAKKLAIMMGLYKEDK